MAKAASDSQTPWPQPGAFVGLYELREVLGAGGMGRVYLATRARDQLGEDLEEVALKILDPELAQRQMVRDFFIQEAELGKKLAHPNLVAFLDSGEYDGFHLLAFEYIHGVSLDRLIKKEGGFENDLALSVLEDVAFGLAAAHQGGIVHRDLKPQNVMITPEDTIKVIDFGLADAAAGIGEGKTVGTPVYAAPEQNLGKKTTASADVYSLGLLTYEMFSGARLLPGGGLKKVLQQQIKLQKVLEKGVPLNPRIPKELGNILRKMLEFKPSERYPSAVEVAADLERALPRRKGSRSSALAKSKAEAVAELADTHYWKALEAAREKNYTDAAFEAGRLVSLRPPGLERLGAALRSELVSLAWDPELGGPVEPDEKAPVPSLEDLEAFGRIAAASELTALKVLLQGRLARLARHYDPEYFAGLSRRAHDAIPVLLALYEDPDTPKSERGRVAESLAWLYLANGCPVRAERIAAEGLELDPGNPALMVAQQQIQRKLKAVQDSKDAISALTRVLASHEDPEVRVEKVRQFAERNPYLPEARQLHIVEARRAGMQDQVAEAYVALGVREFILLEPGCGQSAFMQALQAVPKRSDLQFYLVECLRCCGRVIHLPHGRDARRKALLRLIGHVEPLLEDLEETLTGGEADRETLRELAALAAERPDTARSADYLVKLGALELGLGDAAASRQAFDQALGISPQRSHTVHAIQAVPSIGSIFNRLELARLASEAS